MKRLIIIFSCLYFTTVFSYGQHCKESFLGSKTLYQNPQQKYTPAPKDYLPVFINHVGRHGARHLTKDVNTTYIYQLLLKADSLNGLTADGKLLKEKVLRLEKVEKKNFKSISYLGKTEQQGLADRMYANNTTVFSLPKPVLNIDYTKEVRTLQTSDAFLDELKTKINVPYITRQINDTTLRFYDLSPAYLDFKENGDWIQTLEALKESLKYKEIAKQISRRFFTPSFFNGLNEKDQDNFTSDLYGFITIFYSIQKEIEEAGYTKNDLDMESLIPCPELATLGKISDAEDFLVKGPGTNVDGLQVKIALPLLADFIKTIDEYIKTKAINAKLRFTHAEAIAPYAALMGITGASKATKNINEINVVWKAEKIIQLSSNIQWILYKKEAAENYLIKFLLNEKEVAITGLTTKTFPYYNWNDVRAYYIKKIQSFNTSLDADYLEYLKELK
jgi:multiple inositol-polyphosphate phosphatase / 2,3-bisphosphoglycerate 3-phosphatase